MKRLVYTLMGFVLLLTAVSACKENDDETTLSSDCYISNFTLGAMKRQVHFTDTAGRDTTFYVSFIGGNYPLNINQREQTILLQTPLPTGTRLDAVLATVNFEGALTYRAWDTSASDTAWHTYNSKDSIDFSQPLRFRVYATDGHSFRDYYLRLDVRTTEPGEYTWERVSDALTDEAAARKLLMCDFTLGLMAQPDAQGTCSWRQSDYDDQTPLGRTWTPPATAMAEGLPLTADCSTLQYYNGRLWVSSADGRQLWSRAMTDADFTPACTFGTATDVQSLRLFAASTYGLYGLGTAADGQRAIYHSADGQAWTAMGADADLALFPTNPAAVQYLQLNGNQRVLVAGTSSADASTCEVWSLLEDSDEPWIYYTPSAENHYRLPALDNLSILFYDEFLVAIGTTKATESKAAKVTCYVSRDNGITWKADANLTIPAEVAAMPWQHSATTFDGNIWLSIGTQLWRARLNSYGE